MEKGLGFKIRSPSFPASVSSVFSVVKNPAVYLYLYFTHLSLGEIITCSLGNFSSASL
jgi:hypothetical protein